MNIILSRIIFKFMITLKLFDNENEITACGAEVDNDAATVTHIVEDDGDIIFLFNLYPYWNYHQ